VTLYQAELRSLPKSRRKGKGTALDCKSSFLVFFLAPETLAKKAGRRDGLVQMMKHIFSVLGVVLAWTAADSTFAAKLGDPAAPLQVKEWIKGKPVDVKDGKNVYVVEFWATWCGPCRVSIPHLTELQKKFKNNGVVIVGLSDEATEKVKTFVGQHADKMDYTVAVDDKEGTSKGYMSAYGQDSIPHAFVVGKDGRVLWHGHPNGGLDDVLAQVVAGKYDLEAAAKKETTQAALETYLMAARTADPNARQMGQQLLEEKSKDTQALCAFVMAILDDPRNKQRDFTLADEALARAEKAAGKKTAQVQSMKAILLFESGKQDEGLALLKQSVELATDEAEKAKIQGWIQVMEKRKEMLAKKP
jgi:thiol-disulfide isomerase/thioredoxin